MGLWHGVEHFEKMKITEVDPEGIEFFVRGWPKILIDNTSFRYDWSYIVAWIGVGMCLGSAILFSLAALCIKSDKEREEAMNMQYLMPGTYSQSLETAARDFFKKMKRTAGVAAQELLRAITLLLPY